MPLLALSADDLARYRWMTTRIRHLDRWARDCDREGEAALAERHRDSAARWRGERDALGRAVDA